MSTFARDHQIREIRSKDASKTSLVFKLLPVQRTLAQPMIPTTTVEHNNADKTCHVCFGFSDLKV